MIRRDVPPGALAVTSGQQRNIEGWVLRKREGPPSAEAARAALESGPGVEDTGQSGTQS